jgi:hypothetical protein
MLALGITAMFLNKFMELKKREGVKFSFGFWIKNNYLKTLLGAIIMTALYIGRDSVKDLIGFDLNNIWGCFLFGWGCQFFIAKVISWTPIKG